MGEEKLRKEAAEKKEAEDLAKKKALEDAERKRQEMMAAQKEKGGKKSQAPAMDARLEIRQIKSGTPLLCLRLTSTTMSRGSSTKTMSSKNWQRGRSCSLGTRPSKRVLTQNPSPAPTPQPFTCSQSMSVGLTPEPTATGRSCTKVELRSSGQKCWRPHGRKSLPNGQRGQRQDCQNGLVFVQAKRLEIQIPLRVRKMQLQRKMLRKKTTMRRKKKRRRRKRRSKQVDFSV